MARRLASAYAAEQCGLSYAHCAQIWWSARFHAGLTDQVINQWRAAFPGWSIQELPVCHGPSCNIQSFRALGGLLGTVWHADYPDPQDFFSNLWTTHAHYNDGHVSIPQVDRLCAQADGMSDQAARVPLYQQAEQLLVSQVAAIPLYQFIDMHAVRS
jgi:ABC-type transport system substrate-binding protein